MKRSTRILKNQAWRFVRDESGQSTTEYVLLLLFVVIMVKNAGTQLSGKVKQLLDTAFQKTDAAVQNAGE